MEWDNEKCLKLIDLYRLKPEIWKSTHNLYHNKFKKHDAWCDIAEKMETTVDIVKAKINSLLSSFRREKAKQVASMGTGKGTDEVYRSKWFGFEAFQFLIDKDKCQKTIDTCQKKISESHEEIVEDEISQDLAVFGDPEITNEEDLSEKTEHVLVTETAMNTQDSTNIDLEVTSKKIMKQPQLTQPKPKKRKIQATSEDSRIDQAFSILQSSAHRNASDIYGEHIAMKLKSYSTRIQSVVQHLINNILFEADMGQYENFSPKPTATAFNQLPQGQSTITSQLPTIHSRGNSSANSVRFSSRASTPHYYQPQSPDFGAETYLPNVSRPYYDGSTVQSSNDDNNMEYETLQSARGICPNGSIQSAADLLQNFNPNSQPDIPIISTLVQTLK